LAAVNAVEAANEKPYIRVISYTPNVFAQGNSRELRIVVANEGKSASSSETAVKFITDDDFIDLPENTVLLGRLAPGESKEVVAYINISSEIVNGHTAYLKTVITDGVYSWQDELKFGISSRARIIGSVNTPEVVAAGDKVSLVVDVVNDDRLVVAAELF
jgi:hypothetical protein